jgi:uncharacterized membrane protein (UPF0127 family)
VSLASSAAGPAGRRATVHGLIVTMRATANRLAVLFGVAVCVLGCASDDATSTTPSSASTAESAAPSGSAVVSSSSGLLDTVADTTIADTNIADTSGVTTGPATRPEGFTTIQARITAADGEVCEVCLWLADSAEERGRGLMGVTDLGDAGGMAFLFESATNGAFYMFQTPTPLSIAWFGEDGRWVGSADMEPCLDESAAACELYSPGGAAYTIGVETFLGGLDPLLLVEGSTIELLADTEGLECQTPSS